MVKEVEIMYCPRQTSSRMARPEWRIWLIPSAYCFLFLSVWTTLILATICNNVNYSAICLPSGIGEGLAKRWIIFLLFTQFHPRVTSWLGFGKLVKSRGETWNLALNHCQGKWSFDTRFTWVNSDEKGPQELSSPNFYSKQCELWDEISFLRTCHREDLFEVEIEQLCLKTRLRDAYVK